MEVSEEISAQTNHFDQCKTDSDLEFHQPPSSSNGDSDHATSDLVHAAEDADGGGGDDGGITEKIASLEVKDTEEEAQKSESDEKGERGTVEKDVKETEEEEEASKSKSKSESESEEKEEEEEESESDEKGERGTTEKDVKETEEEEEASKSKSKSESESEEKEEEEEKAIEKDLSGEEIGDRSESENGDENDQEEGEKNHEVEGENEVNSGGDELEKRDERGGVRKYQYPVRPEAEDCSFYLKTGTCKFGSNCKFNHPVRKKTNNHNHHHHHHHPASKERAREKEESSEKSGLSECKYYLRSGGCKFGKACKYNHTRGKMTPAVAPVLEFNFVGLPIRVGERECPYYMRTGSCKYGMHCRFNHPDPTDAAGSDNSTGYGNGGPVSLQGGSQSTMASWSSSRSLNDPAPPPPPPPPPAPYVPMMVPTTPVVPSPNTEWNGYQAPVYLPPDRNLPPPPAYGMNNLAETGIYQHQPPQQQVEDYPERPGQPDCSFFLKTGDCKFKSNCKYHHPKNRASMKPPCALSDKGLPLRPDQNICTHFSRYGICKFGPACKYDHSPAKTGSGVDNQPPYGHSATVEGTGMSRSGSRSEVTVQQSV